MRKPKKSSPRKPKKSDRQSKKSNTPTRVYEIKMKVMVSDPEAVRVHARKVIVGNYCLEGSEDLMTDADFDAERAEVSEADAGAIDVGDSLMDIDLPQGIELISFEAHPSAVEPKLQAVVKLKPTSGS